ncbi:hypothetical protein [Sporosarcina koreensis]|uniref:hypothetical protein n=1 Tax=Sporosarcina koreensis TaxID=334735 RepID=UPI00058F72AC|nr:hypothetical protein [Sporosarcina koreensis]
MDRSAHPELQNIVKELEKVKQQDAVLAQIEERLYRMKDIAQYAAANDLDEKEAAKLNEEIQEQLAAIQKLKIDYADL